MGLPIEAFAPTVVNIGGKLYFAAFDTCIYTTNDPARGKWTLASRGLKVGGDPDLFLATDGRLYLYAGCSNKSAIRGVELDIKHHFKPMGAYVNLISGDPLHRGWEASRNKLSDLEKGKMNPNLAPWIEGSWMNKVGGVYYLQYAAPGTQYDTYGDGVCTSRHPLGPFKYQPYSPFSLKPTGFARGAGHSSTFKDARGNYWHISTITISVRNIFERRLGVYPVRFFPEGQMACNTYLGDYPQYPPGVAKDPFMSNSPGWMLLSLDKPASVSSTLPKHPARMAVDENLHDWWSAATGNPGEWLQVDLGKRCRIQAIQINFADQDSTQLGRLKKGDAYRYLVRVSSDGVQWKTLLDRRKNTQDAPQDYAQFATPVMGRYVRIINFHTPAKARFSISGLRVFGNAMGSVPGAVRKVTARRDPLNGRIVHISWTASPGADFYIIRYGIKPDRLYSNYQVYGATDVTLDLLNSNVGYFVTVDAVNSSGITSGPAAVSIR